MAHVSFLWNYQTPKDHRDEMARDLLSEYATDGVTAVLASDETQTRRGDTVAVVRASSREQCDLEVLNFLRHGNGGCFQELRRRRVRNKAGRYVLEYEVALLGGPGRDTV